MSLKEDLFSVLSQYFGDAYEFNSVNFYGQHGEERDVYIRGEIYKAKETKEKRMAYGFASVIDKDGEPIIDSHNHKIDEETLIKAAHNFIKMYRNSKEMHNGPSIGDVVESIVLSKDIREVLGIEKDMTGWFIGMKINDDDVWEKIKSKEYKMFSIGGTAISELAKGLQ